MNELNNDNNGEKRGKNMPEGIRFNSGYQPSPEAKSQGWKEKRHVRELTTAILNVTARFPDTIFQKMRDIYPEIEQEMSVVEMMTLIQVSRAIKEGDTLAYKSVLDRAFGKPPEELELHQNITPKFKIVIKPKIKLDEQSQEPDE